MVNFSHPYLEHFGWFITSVLGLGFCLTVVSGTLARPRAQKSVYDFPVNIDKHLDYLQFLLKTFAIPINESEKMYFP